MTNKRTRSAPQTLPSLPVCEIPREERAVSWHGCGASMINGSSRTPKGSARSVHTERGGLLRCSAGPAHSMDRIAQAAMDQETARALFDYRDGALFWRTTRGSNAIAGMRAGRRVATGYRSIHIGGRRYQEHRLIYLWHHGFLPQEIDHANGVKDDNRIVNLRPCDHSLNQANTRSRTDARGVRQKRGKWEGRVWLRGREIRVGIFKEKDTAVAACRKLRRELFGEFAQ